MKDTAVVSILLSIKKDMANENLKIIRS